MLRRLKSHATPATVIAIIALIVALGGTAVAGGVLNKKKVNNIITNRASGLSVLKAKSADSASTAGTAGSATADNVFGAETTGGSGIVNATLPGTTATKSSNTFTIHFPRAVVDCVVAGSGLFDGDTSVVRSGTANPNDVIASNPSGTNVEVIVVCPN
jgi:hypothetical protein